MSVWCSLVVRGRPESIIRMLYCERVGEGEKDLDTGTSAYIACMVEHPHDSR